MQESLEHYELESAGAYRVPVRFPHDLVLPGIVSQRSNAQGQRWISKVYTIAAKIKFRNTKSVHLNNSELDPQWRMLFNHLMFYTGFYEPDEHTQAEYDQFQIRWNWLMYLQARFENNLDLAVDYLYSVSHLYF